MAGFKTYRWGSVLKPVAFGLVWGGVVLLGCYLARPIFAGSARRIPARQLRGGHRAVAKSWETASYRSDWRILLVKSLLTVGRYEEAATNAAAD